MPDEIKKPGDQPPAPEPKAANKGKARIEIKVEFELDDASVFNLRGDGIKTTSVVSN